MTTAFDFPSATCERQLRKGSGAANQGCRRLRSFYIPVRPKVGRTIGLCRLSFARKIALSLSKGSSERAAPGTDPNAADERDLG